jgi:hypothetical protein
MRPGDVGQTSLGNIPSVGGRLNAELKRVIEARDILQKAGACFAKHSG